jgi:hypothetical protein
VLCPAPVSRGFAGETGPREEPAEFVGIIIGLYEPVLIPHGVGDDTIEGAEPTAFVPELGVLEGVAEEARDVERGVEAEAVVTVDEDDRGAGGGVGCGIL